MIKEKQVYLILHNIRSVQNVGSIFRTADATGVSKIFLTGYTPTPIDRFGRERKDFAKTALGAQKNIMWEYVKLVSSVVNRLRKQKTMIVSVEQSVKSVDYKKLKIKYPVAFILGNEVKGLSKTILDKSDAVVHINMLGKKESLNVSVTTGILLYRVLNI